MTMAYSCFGNTTGKHGPSITRRLEMAIKIRLARHHRKWRRVTTLPRHTRAHHNKRGVHNRFSSRSWR